MNPRFERGRILFMQRRYDLAAREFQEAIGIDPTLTAAQSMLALCQCELKKYKDAIATARAAIAADPERSYSHYVLAHIYFRCNRLKEARAAIQEAIRLNPGDAMYYGQHALIEFNLRKWDVALKMAEEGLSLNPEDIASNIARVRALNRLARKAEAKRAAAELLRIRPDDQYTHANIGFSFLEYGDHRQASEHFREALRINPNLDLAQHGLIEALRCRFPLNRVAHLIGPDRNLTFRTALMWLFLLPILGPLMILALLLRPVSSLLLLLDRSAKQIMTRDQIAESIISGSSSVMAICCFAVYFSFSKNQFLLASSSLFAVAFLIMIAFRSRKLWPRRAALSLVAVFAIALIAMQIHHLGFIEEQNRRFVQGIDDDVGGRIGLTWVAVAILMPMLVRIAQIVPSSSKG